MKQMEWLLVGLLAIGAFTAGCIGFREYAANASIAYGLSDNLYHTLQLLTLNSGAVPPPIPWKLEAARFLAPILFFYTLLRAGFLVFHERLSLLPLRRMEQHVILCGYGRIGQCLADGFLKQKKRVVVIEQDVEHPDLALAKQKGILVLPGNATREEVLAKAGLERASDLIITCGSDGTNTAVATAAHTHLQQSTSWKRSITGRVHLENQQVHPMLEPYECRQGANGFSLRPFSISEISARRVLKEFPLDRNGITPDSPLRPHLVIVGLGSFGESMLLQALRCGHYANRRLLKVTVVDQRATMRRQELLVRFPALPTLADIEFVETNGESPEGFTSLPEWENDANFLLTLAVCFDDDEKSLNTSLMLSHLVRSRNIPILARMTRNQGLASLLRNLDHRGEVGCDIHPFGEIDYACDVEYVMEEGLDLMARHVHQHYLQKRLKDGVRLNSTPAMRVWDHLPESFRRANREQADHIPVKLRALGDSTVVSQPADLPDLSQEQVEHLAPMEHARWSASKILQGWAYGPERDDRSKTTPHLVPWEELDESVRELDREAIREIPSLLRTSSPRT